MKKSVSGLLMALLLCAACSVPAFAAEQPVISGPDRVAEGDVISIAVRTSAEGFAGDVEAKGLEVLSAAGSLLPEDLDVVIMLSRESGEATFQCRVTAQAGETASFGVVNAEEADGDQSYSVTLDPWTATVGEPGREVEAEAPAESVTPDVPQSGPAGNTEEDTSVPEPASEAPEASKPAEGAVDAAPSAANTEAAADAAADGSAAPAGSEKLPKTADSSVDSWILLVAGVAGACIALVAGREVLARRRG